MKKNNRETESSVNKKELIKFIEKHTPKERRELLAKATRHLEEKSKKTDTPSWVEDAFEIPYWMKFSLTIGFRAMNALRFNSLLTQYIGGEISKEEFDAQLARMTEANKAFADMLK